MPFYEQVHFHRYITNKSILKKAIHAIFTLVIYLECLPTETYH